MRDIVNNIGFQQVIAPAVLAATTTSAGIDLANFDSAALVINTGAIVGAGDFGVKLQESDDNSAWNDVPSAQVVGSVPATLTANGTFKLGYAGWKRYLRAVATKAGGTSLALGAVLVQGHPRKQPVA